MLYRNETSDNRIPGHFFFSHHLLDAYEGRTYAEYLWGEKQGKKYWEVPPIFCRLIPSSGQEQSCNSEEEYKAFVARYTE